MTAAPAPEAFADSLMAETLYSFVAGGETLVAACDALGLDPRSIYSRRGRDAKFRERIEEAEAISVDRQIDFCNAIADKAEELDDNGNLRTKDVKRDALRVKTRLEIAKMRDRRYNVQKVEVEQRTANVEIPVGDDPVAATRAYEELIGKK